VSIRRRHSGYWNRHYLKLTFDNEFAIPADVSHLKPGTEVEVKIHRIIPDVSTESRQAADVPAARLLLELAQEDRPGWRSDGSMRLDDYLNEEIHGNDRVR
jgi:hypothetical protein